MSQEMVIKGVIGKTEDMKPTLRRTQKVVRNQVVTNDFMYFKMFVQDTSQKKDENGFYPSIVYQVQLTNDDNGRNVFKNLTAGRKIKVSGFYTEQVNGQYTNRVIKNPRIEYLDMPFDRYGQMVFDKITDGQMADILAATQSPTEVKAMMLAAFMKTAKEEFETGRVIIDNIEEKLPIKSPLIE